MTRIITEKRGSHPNSRKALTAASGKARAAVHNKALALWVPRADELRAWTKRGISQTEIGRRYGVTQRCVGVWLHRLGIKANGKANHGPKNGRYRDGSESRGYRNLITKDKCSDCGTSECLGVHHVNGDHYDDNPENLRVLCARCHMRLEAKEMWQARRDGKPARSNAPVHWKPKSGGSYYRRARRSNGATV